ncbi:thioredoxin domain-containing protein [Streptomyces sp. 3MP-14]|uniref:Thioredoxin domain-containing protein n=1 Tax=Streptomyces mimosae TaxID=2586635 RepID=A0A5N6AKG2_9ACTN|nr:MULTISPECIES: thioredoxin domain-containing protein [Streptomyces]KAB8168685.1 thioredoxin domain-containing protein [Streptomyces mimosae]KAB8178035.1 thioredoxin domain-containing protein [Streptomyces sp. 3MP-14]
MSKRNSQEAKRAARERLLAERQKQKKKDKIRRQLVVGGSVVAILAIAAGIGVAVANMDGGSEGDATDWSAVRAEVDENADSVAAPSNATGEDGLTVLIGDPEAANTVTLYEDPRCPSCAAFEQGVGESIHEGIENGDYNVEYVFGTFLDERLGGTGSRNAVSALGAALDVSPEAFQGLHEQLYAVDNHPSESTDDFGSDERLIELAQNVPELEGNADFETAVNNSMFAGWALQMSDKFDGTEDVSGTPTIKVNGQVVEAPRSAADWEAILATTLVEDQPQDGAEEGAQEGDGEAPEEGAEEEPGTE